MQATATKQAARIVNGIDVDELTASIGEIAKDPAKAHTRWKVTTSWKGGTRSETQVDGYEIGGQYVKKNFRIQTDEPLELGGTNLAANPQEVLMAALNACMTVGYTALCSLEGITLEELRIETQGDIDLRGFLGLDPNVKPGYDEIQYRVHIRGNGTPEQFRNIHERVIATSPNRFNLANPIRLKAGLVVE
jgi:uncharacterized OsmC-like protein